MKRKLSLLLSMLLIFSLCISSGCGHKEANSAAAQSKDYVYSFVSWNDKVQDIEFSQALYANERLIITSYRYEDVPVDNSGMSGEEYFDEPVEEIMEEEVVEEAIEVEEEAAVEEVAVEAVAVTEDVAIDYAAEEFYMEDMYFEEFSQNTYFKVSQLDLEGNLITEFEILIPSDAGIHTFCADDVGNIYLVLCEYGKDMSNPDYVKDLFSLIAYSETGEELFRTQLGTDIEAEDLYYVNQMICNQTQIFLSSTKGLEIYEVDGSLVKTMESEEIQNGSMYMLRDGQPAFLIYGNRGMYMKTWDLETEELSERINFPFNAYEYAFYPGSSTDLLLSSNTGVYSYNFEDEGMQKVLDFVDSDMLCNNLYSLIEVKEKQFFGCYYDNERK